MNEAKTPTRKQFIRDALTMSFATMYFSKHSYDLMFYWMFYHQDNEAFNLSSSSNKDLNDIANALKNIPRELQVKLISRILANPEIDNSKQALAVVKLYKD
jgi:hypothetical protein